MIEKHIGKLTKACELCFKGKKSVLFITGKCPRNCIYCPLSKEKKNKDIININEVKLKKPEIKKIIKEIKLSDSSGTGITGGDPLAVLSRTTKIIRTLKKEFGKNFNIHLYTSLELLNKNSLVKLKKAGLDELRIHPDIFNKSIWEKIKFPKQLNIKFKEFGIEIPAIPNEEKRITELIQFSKDYVDFYNLNELEYAALYERIYKKKNWKVQEDYSVKGSEGTALNIIKHYSKSKLRIHYCSSRFKDSVQFTNRVKVRAENLAHTFDRITPEGTLLRGAIYINENTNLNQIINYLKKQNAKFLIEKDKSRIIFNYKLAPRLSKQFKNISITEEYPTVDGLVVEEQRLS
jgi:pyruvate formate-lyase activating enzyme-like uncharacterized protein